MRSLRSTRPAARRAHRRGRPLRQSVLSGWTADHYTPAVTRRFLYDTGWNGRAEIDEAGAVVRRGLWGLDVSGSRAGVGGVGGLLAVQMLTGPATGLNYPLYDGNITEYLNAAGTVAAHYKYDPFGCIYASSGALKDAFPYRFSTKRLDAATGLYYYGYRYYDPITGRWPSRDPIEEQGRVNLYGFGENDPLNKWDVLGMATTTFNSITVKRKIFCGLNFCELKSARNNPARKKIHMVTGGLNLMGRAMVGGQLPACLPSGERCSGSLVASTAQIERMQKALRLIQRTSMMAIGQMKRFIRGCGLDF